MLTFLLMMAAQAVPAMQTQPAAACTVWQRERAFADSVRRHDGAAFAAILDADAVFGVNGKAQQRGRAVIARQWASIVSGKAGKLEWYPDRVVVAESGDLAWSTGPALFEVPDGKGGAKPMLSRFSSVWRRNADGEWRVVFDSGSDPAPASAEQVKAFHDGDAQACPTT